MRRLAAEIARFTLDEAEERRRSGRLEFHDLLVLARRLLRDPDHGSERASAAAAALPRASCSTSSRTPTRSRSTSRCSWRRPTRTPGSKPWSDVEVEPGRLFVVGDPEAVDLPVPPCRHRDVPRGPRLARRTAAVAHDATGARRLRSSSGSTRRSATSSSPPGARSPSTKRWSPGATRPRSGPPVTLLGVDEHDSKLERRRSARARGGRRRRGGPCRRSATAGRSTPGSTTNGDERWRPARLGDITILLPTRTSLPAPRDGVGRRRHPVPGRVVVARVRDPRDPRPARWCSGPSTTPPTSCRSSRRCGRPFSGAVTTTSSRSATDFGGSWNHQAPPARRLPDDHPVGRGHAVPGRRSTNRARGLPRASCWPGSCATGGSSSSGFAQGRPRDLWRRVRFVVDQARAFGDAQGGGVREFLEWTRLQSDEGARVTETVLPETDDDSVRILTIHGAKGLEFPITILSGMSTRPMNRQRGRPGHVAAQWRLRAEAHERREDRRVREVPTDRRTDELPREASAALRRCDPRSRSPRRVAAPQGSRQEAGDRAVDERRTLDARRVAKMHHTREELVEASRPHLPSQPAATVMAPWQVVTSGRPELHEILERGSVSRTIAATTVARRPPKNASAARPTRSVKRACRRISRGS